jgi:radical SAM superfamily enzyme YgiQ (UPF0313 family)
VEPRTTIVFPPCADPSLPYGALPLLGAVLRRAGYQEVFLRDLNLEAFNDLLHPDPLRRAGNELTRVPTWAATAVANIEEARRVLRDPVDFYRPDRLLFAKYIFSLACTLLTANHPRLRFGKYSYSSSGYDSYEQIAQAVAEDDGPLGGYLRGTAVPSLLAQRPDIVGISVPYFSQLVPSFLLAEAIRAVAPQVHLCFGGPVVSWGKEVLLRDPRFSRWMDSFVVGEADEVFLYLVEAIAGDRDIGTVPNLVRYTAGAVIPQLRPEVHPHLDWLPTPDFTLLPMDRYLAPHQIICLTPTRGCYYNKCAFCNYSFIKLTPYRMRSPQLIAEDVATITATTGQDVFCFESDVILPNDLRLISEALLHRGTEISWHAVARFEKGFTPELVRTMRQAGCIRLYMGLESANDRVLDAMSKGTDRARMTKILRMCHAAGIAVEAGVFSGFPSETPADAEDTYRFIRDHADVISRADAATFRLLKGSPVADEPQRYGITLLDDPSRRWYHLPFTEQPQPATPGWGDADQLGLPESRDESVMARLQKLYPQAALIDVPEDILYTARHGPDALRQFFKNPHLPTPAAVATRHSPVADDAVAVLTAGYELRQLTVTNAGAVHLDVLGPGSPAPVFERSAFSITVLVDHDRSSIRPLDAAEERFLRLIVPNGSTVCRIRAAFDETGAADESHRLLAELSSADVIRLIPVPPDAHTEHPRDSGSPG